MMNCNQFLSYSVSYTHSEDLKLLKLGMQFHVRSQKDCVWYKSVSHNDGYSLSHAVT